jgi:hypothetical protein
MSRPFDIWIVDVWIVKEVCIISEGDQKYMIEVVGAARPWVPPVIPTG